MVIAALLSFGALAVAWILAPGGEEKAERRTIETEVRPAAA